MNQKLIIPLLTLGLTLAGCSSTPPTNSGTPDWVTGQSKKYARAQYLTGQGEASRADTAKDRARAEIAKIFQVAINEQSSDLSKASMSKNDQGSQSSFSSEISRDIETRTEQIVSGIEIAEFWQDPQLKTYHALAILPRTKARNSLRQEIKGLDEATGKYSDSASKQDDPFRKIGYAIKALEAQQQRTALQQSLKVIDITGQGVKPRWELARMEADLDQLLKRVRIKAGGEGDINTLLAGGLASAGFLPGKEKSDYTLNGSLDVIDVGQKDQWYWLRGTLDIQLLEADSGKVRGTKQWKFKASAADKATAQMRLTEKADKMLKEELRGTLIDFASQ